MLLIQNAHILPIVGDEIESGSLLLDGGRIAAIGTQLPVPPEAEVNQPSKV
jgi:imidazolonepropionase-like amidohydrolase